MKSLFLSLKQLLSKHLALVIDENMIPTILLSMFEGN